MYVNTFHGAEIRSRIYKSPPVQFYIAGETCVQQTKCNFNVREPPFLLKMSCSFYNKEGIISTYTFPRLYLKGEYRKYIEDFQFIIITLLYSHTKHLTPYILLFVSIPESIVQINSPRPICIILLQNQDRNNTQKSLV